MLPNNSTEGNPQAPTGAAEQPTSPTSGAESQPLPEYVTALQSRLDQQDQLIKSLQKGTDKQIGQVRGDIKRILELKEQGLNESQIQRELYIDQLMTGQNTPAPQTAGPAPQSTNLDVEAVVKSLQFADNDPALAALKVVHSGNQQEFLKAAAALRLQQLQSPNPTPGQGLSPTGGNAGGTSAQETEAKARRLNELLAHPTQNLAEIQQLKKELGWK